MSPFDPRVRTYLAPARTQLVFLLAAGVAQTGLLAAQAFVLTGSIVAVVEQRPVEQWALALAAVVVLRATAAIASDNASARAAVVQTPCPRRPATRARPAA